MLSMQAMRVCRFGSEDRPVGHTARAVVSFSENNIQAKDTNVIGRVETKRNNGKQGSKELANKAPLKSLQGFKT